MSRPTRSVITSLRQQRAYSTPNSQSPGEGSPDVNDTTRPISDALSGRQRNVSIQTGRLRAQRRPSPSALPPVQLPPSFFRENLFRYSEHQQPRLPFAISQDLTTEKTSRIFSRLNRHGQYDNEYTEAYFEAALEQLFARDREIAVEIANANQDANIGHSALDAIERRIRVCSMIIDSAWHMVDAIYPTKLPEYTYTSRPFWWWHLQHGIDYKTAMENEQLQAMSKTLTTNLIYNEKLDNTLAQVLADVPVDTFAAIHSSIGTELNSPKSASFNITSSKRPITIFSLSGYKGKGIVEAMASHIAFMEKADVVHLDAQDLATIVGGYLGQSLAFSRGSLSMLGYRTAYLSGRMAQNPTLTPNRERDDPPDHDNTVISTRIAGLKSLEEDLQKVKEGGFDCFSRWEHLKIEKALQTIIDQSLQRESLETQRPLLLHLHDSVELTMTIEGTILLNSLRKIVDSAWAEGKKIAIFGTSSLEDPSDDYNEAIHDLSQTDFVVTRYLQSNEKPSDDGTGLSTGDIAQKDILFENINNIRRMMSSLQPERGALTTEEFASYMPNSCAMRNFIIPASEVYNIARSICFYDADIKMGIETALLRRHSMGPLIQNPRQGLIQEEDGDQNYRTYDNTNATEDSKSDPKGNMKLNEYEKRIATGHINKENLRVSFSDVHVEADIISTLKLLTSLALVRPDAFSYGVLAADKIPGCLLYGPPGTGKTMLAKAVARESGANMLEVSGATINDKWVGESEKLIRAVFTLAKKLSPCVVFIDEADSLLANRSLYSNRASHREHINQFLKEWDGIEETNAFIMVATNRPYDLDDAVLRRLPRRLLIDLPLKADREVILKMLLKGEQLASCVDIDSYADRTIHYSGSDLKNVCVAAAMAAVEEENKAAEQHPGTEPYQYPARRTLKGHHFEAALSNIPASINEDMASLRLIRNFDSQYGSKRRSGAKKLMGFGVVDDKTPVDSNDARIRSDAA